MIAIVVTRFVRAAGALRRALGPVLGTGALVLGVLFVQLVVDTVSEDAAEPLYFLFLVTFALVPVAFLAGVLRSRLARSGVADLLVELGRGVPLRDAVAHSLRDPSLDLVYWLPEREQLVLPDGTPFPGGDGIRLRHDVRRNGKLVGALIHDPSLADEPELVDAVAAAAALWLENERLQAEVRAQFVFLETIVNTAPSLLMSLEPDGRIANYNTACERASGYENVEDVRHEYFWDVFISPGERDEVRERFQKNPAHPAATWENTFVNRRGEEMVIAWSTAPLLDESGNVRNIICGGLDVTERKQHEIELDRERDFLSKVGDITPSLLVVVDDEAKVVEDAVNESFVKTMGWGDLEMRGRSFGELFHEEDRYYAAIGVASAFNGVDPQLRLSRWVTREGDIRVVEWTATPIVDILGREHVLVCGVDVTERERREHDLRSSEERLRATIEASPVAVLEVDLDDRIALWNPAAERMFGWTAEEMIGGPLRHIPDEERERLDELMVRVRSGEVYTGIEGKRLCKDGSLIDVEISAAPIRDASDAVISHLALFADISDRKRQEEELRASRARIVKAGDEARRRLERNLHDGAQQRLVALSLSLRLAQSKVGSDPPAAEAVLESAREELAAALDELRELARGIHPAILTDRGLAAALEALASRLPIPVEIETPEVELPQAVEAAAYYVIAEALANVIKYARASVVERPRHVQRDERQGRGRRRRRRRRRSSHRIGAARPLRPRRGARGHARGRQPADRRHPHHGGHPPGSRPRGVGKPAPPETCPPHRRVIACVGVLRHERNPQGGSHVRRSQNRSGPPPRRRNRRRPLVVTRGRQRRRRGAPSRERLVLRALGRALPRPRRLLSPLRLRRAPQPGAPGRGCVENFGPRAASPSACWLPPCARAPGRHPCRPGFAFSTPRRVPARAR